MHESGGWTTLLLRHSLFTAVRPFEKLESVKEKEESQIPTPSHASPSRHDRSPRVAIGGRHCLAVSKVLSRSRRVPRILSLLEPGHGSARDTWTPPAVAEIETGNVDGPRRARPPWRAPRIPPNYCSAQRLSLARDTYARRATRGDIRLGTQKTEISDVASRDRYDIFLRPRLVASRIVYASSRGFFRLLSCRPPSF
ncbi:hypothetical protein H6P81_018729 [Aristolochia fimbriata]|uniref:Uncharacterized protein n=1 Tax=Aristolochia fimbriata TaxID=158543 RepID=A0AAV7E1U4_ARIFI|nr:hypothetical protein H6P81_018729 [Aristolochia fimbriata]